jgi:hypothetical protein
VLTFPAKRLMVPVGAMASSCPFRIPWREIPARMSSGSVRTHSPSSYFSRRKPGKGLRSRASEIDVR